MIGNLFAWLGDPAHWSGSDGIWARLAEHLEYSSIAVLIALLLAVPAGLYIGHTGRGTVAVASVANALRALPTVGLLVLAVLILLPRLSGNLGFQAPSILVLVILAIPPILTSTYAGVQQVDPAARDAAYGIGMTGREVLWQVEVPNSLPLMFSGFRSAVLQVVATATVAAYVSLGGLGRFVIDGQQQRDYPQMLAGAVLVAALAVLIDVVLAGVQRYAVPRGLTGRYRRLPRQGAVGAAGSSSGAMAAENRTGAPAQPIS